MVVPRGLTASAAVTEWGGKVAKKLDDGFIALFGFPVAQENDLEWAAHAAHAIQRSLTELNRKKDGEPTLAARIIIDSGPMVIDAVSEIFGELPKVLREPRSRTMLGYDAAAPDASAIHRPGPRQYEFTSCPRA
jgi:hypothetical protein